MPYRIRVLLLALVVSFVLVSRAVLAMSVTPIVLDLQGLGGRSSGSIAVTNPNAAPLPVELTIFAITIDDRGQIVTKTEAMDDFIVLPPQAIIPPGGTQNFRIQYVGDDQIAQSQLYQFQVDQLPVVPKDDGNTQLQIVYSITGLLTLAPLNAEADIKVVATGIEEDDQGARFPAITLRNAGTKHAYLSRGSLELKHLLNDGSVAWRDAISSSRIEREIGFGLMAPQSERTFRLPYPLKSDGGTIEAQFDKRDQ